MQNQFSRWLFFYDAHLETNPNSAKHVRLAEIERPLISVIRNKRAVRLYKKKTSALRIVQIKIYNNRIAVLLLQYADTKETLINRPDLG